MSAAAHRLELAVVLVDSDEHPILPGVLDAAVASLVGLRAEVVIVDSRSTAGRSWIGRNRARVISADRASGQTSTRIRAMDTTDAPFVAFLDAATEPSRAWARAATQTLARDESLGAVSAASAGIGEPTLSFTGNVGQRARIDDRSVHQVLFPIPEACVIRRDAIDDVGGIWDELAWPEAIVDLGWRLTLAGRRVVMDPAVQVTGLCTCTPDSYSGLAVIHSCLAEEVLPRTLPAALLVAAHRDAEQVPRGDSVERFLAATPVLGRRRTQTQSTRAADDHNVLPLLRAALEPARGDDGRREVYVSAVAKYGLERFLPARQRVLIVTPDTLAARMAGPAIRAWQIADALAGRHEVHLASTASRCELSSRRFAVTASDDEELKALARWSDVILLQGFAMENRPFLRDEEKIVIVDLYDPLHLEQLELFRDASDAHRRVTVRGATRVLNEQLVRGDFFVCASTKQRDFWLGQLAAVGRVNHLVYDDDNRLGRLLQVVPFGLPDAPPTAMSPAIKGVVPGIGPDDEVILWGGGIYNWFDPLTLIRAVARLKERRPAVRLFFMGLRHPNPDVSEMRVATEARRLARELRLTDRYVFFNEGWVPYDERQNFLLDADVGVSTHFDHLETQFSFRTRVLDYIWAGLPIVSTDGDWFAELVAKEGIGLVVPPTDVAALDSALNRVLADRPFADSCRTSLDRVRGQFAWSRALAPIVEFCDHPRRAPDLADPEMRSSLWSPAVHRPRPLPSDQRGMSDRLRAVLAGANGTRLDR